MRKRKNKIRKEAFIFSFPHSSGYKEKIMNTISFNACQDILENIADGVRVIDNEGTVIYVNRSLCSLLGYDRTELIGKSIYDIYPPEDRASVEKHVVLWKTGKKDRYEVEHTNRVGRKLFMEVSSVPIFDEEKSYQGTYTVIRDITERKQIETEVLKEKNFLNKMISLCPDGIIGVNRHGTIILFNRAAEKLTGYAGEEIIGRMPISDLYHPQESARVIKKKLYSSEFGEVGQLEGFEAAVSTRYGQNVPIRLSAALIFEEGKEVGSVGFFHDLTARKLMEARLRELSITDSLSGLNNQRHFYTVLNEEMDRSRRYDRPLSLICFDIDNFKLCNDKLGHLEGDNIIRMVGQILRERLRSSDHAFRYGGDEFMVILTETDLPKAFFSAERIRKEFNSRWSYDSVFEGAGLKRITLSLGVAEIGPEEITDTFIKRSDLAMYEAKRAGGDQTVEATSQIGKFRHGI